MSRAALAALAVLAALAAGCASVKPYVSCRLTGQAEVMQGVSGIGVGQALPDADRLCAPLVAKAASSS